MYSEAIIQQDQGDWDLDPIARSTLFHWWPSQVTLQLSYLDGPPSYLSDDRNWLTSNHSKNLRNCMKSWLRTTNKQLAEMIIQAPNSHLTNGQFGTAPSISPKT